MITLVMYSHFPGVQEMGFWNKPNMLGLLSYKLMAALKSFFLVSFSSFLTLRHRWEYYQSLIIEVR